MRRLMFAGILACTLAVAAIFAATGGAHTGPPPPGDPQCQKVTANTNLIWPPNHKFEEIKLSVPNATTDQIRIYKITQDEPVEGLGDGDFGPDAFYGEDRHTALVRAERSGLGDGRVYRIAFDVFVDGEKSCSYAVYVGVPHDMGPPNRHTGGREPIDSGQDYNSLVGGDHNTPSQGGDDGTAPHKNVGPLFK